MNKQVPVWVISIAIALLLDSTMAGLMTAVGATYLLKRRDGGEPQPPGKTLITGAEGGLGSEIKKREERNGRQTISWDYGTVDVRDRHLVSTKYKELFKNGDTIDAIYCTAGVTSIKSIDTLQQCDITRTCDTNIRGVIWLLQAILLNLDSCPVKRICVVSSAVANVGTISLLSEYCASKWALTAFLESVRPFIEAKGISLTIVSPSFMTTSMFPGVRMRGIQNLISPPLHPYSVAHRSVFGVANREPQIFLPPLFWLVRLAAAVLPVAVVDFGAMLVGVHHAADSIVRDPLKHGT
eukprot:TRINITY_DN20309_c0_g1_i1.p1 TRINITY_DN20309_c0_g1~~TRINITY_DN20309_c0_g1_i1.p1  ORF type:complete len:296 (+),score=39.56 TRINITY_DN20309_c0_g1_i1:19-906(+)